MASTMTMTDEKFVVRPLKLLVPLIKEDLAHGDEAAQNASMPYYAAAGAKMLEAKGQLARGEFMPWVKRNFDRSQSQANLYMSYAATQNTQNNGPDTSFASLEDFKRRHLGHKGSTPGSQRDKAWQEPARETIQKAKQDAKRLHDEELTRQQERNAEKKLALQLIDIGFKALASKLHPDKGGSRDAMSRLNRVRARLKQHA